MGNSLIFEAPARSYSTVTYQHILEMVPTNRGTQIPCLYIAPDPSTQVLLIYFHGNAEDNGLCFSFAYSLHEKFKVDVIMVEYPGYGIYRGEPSEQAIYDDANSVMSYMTGQYGSRKTYRLENVIVVGRSLGSAPALELASKYSDLGGVVLLAPFTSIKDVADNKSWLLAFVTPLISNIFNNESRAARVMIPILLVHGTADTVVPHQHSERLARVCRSPYKVVKYIEGMTHNGLNLDRDLMPALSEFFRTFVPQITSPGSKYQSHRPAFPSHREPPLARAQTTDPSPRKYMSQSPYLKPEHTGFPGPSEKMSPTYPTAAPQQHYPSRLDTEATTYSSQIHRPSASQSQISMGRPQQTTPVNGINVRYYGSNFGAPPPQPPVQSPPQSMRASEDYMKSAFYC